ncbi:MAG: hypothetical protein U0934_12735 [Pseudotabrizicola sp.]|uniref:hypothetical protein n=1 Tax=Pseudotabrizicola sp. TaxID=2939647 RepID=UPI002730856E|nr:hypothetical protein [Pseudotabrizicola sp.]MDP2079803.1 hypothetical protein [Pseudotabrizicola sp.]MDZ7574804.1 hypothetical protein [Pseudotabrizicola sp.]
MRILIALTLALTATSGCAVLDRLKPATAATAATAAPDASDASEPVAAAPAPVLGAGGNTAAALDTTTAAQKQAALAAPAASGERELGKVTVSLGSPAEPGIWLRSALVTAPGKGRVVTASGQSVAVDLLPGQGAAQLSLAAYMALGLSLTALPEVTVFAN